MASSSGADTGSFPEARFYRLALESLPDTVFVATTDGDITWVCSNVAEIFGPDPARIIESETVASVLSPAFVDPIDPESDRLQNQPFTITDDDGVVHHFLVTVVRITIDDHDENGESDEGEELLVYACRDVTAVERLESELAEVHDRITDGFIALDTDLVITHVNDYAVELFGRPRTELIGKSLWEFTPDPESTDAYELFPAALETGVDLSYETYFEPQDRWYEARVYPSDTGLSVYFRDITTRVESNRKLEANEARFRTLFDQLPDPLIVIDDDAEIVDVNPAMCTFVGASKEELLGTHVATLTDESFDFDTVWTTLRETGTCRGEVTIDCFDGGHRIADYLGVADVLPGEHIAALRDVTEREAYRTKLDEVYDRITDGFFSVDSDLVVEYANTQFAQSVGYDPDDLVGESIWDVVDDPETLEAFELLPEVLESGEPTVYQGHDEPADSWYEIAVYPSETGLSIYSRDITTRVEQAQALEESEARFRSLFEGTLDALVLADDDGRYLDANPAACELYGESHDELLGKTVADFAPPGFDFDGAWSAFLDAEAMRGEFELVRADGDTRIVDFAARANIRPGEHLSVLRDSTERVERERQLEVQRDELAHLNHINRLVREVNQAIVGADTLHEVFSGVCRRLVDADVYQHALVATETAGGRIEVAAAAGLTVPTAEAVVEAFARELTTAGRRVTSVIAPSPESIRSHVDADVFGCFPLAYDETVHGILVIGADRSGETPVLVGEEQHLLDDLGVTVGKAITAVTARRLLHADEVVTLEFTVDDTDEVFNELSRQLGATVTVTALVPMADGRHACYLTVDGSNAHEPWDCESVCRTAESLDAVNGCRVINVDEAVQLEVHVDDSSPALALETQGTHVRTLSSTNGQGTLVVEVPADSNVRNLVSGLVTDYPQTRLIRKLTERRTGARAGEIGGRRSRLSDEASRPLTEKQLAALRAAHAGGYYDWPRRGSSAQELAEALGVAPATYHQHLRAAEGKLVDAFFEA